jgi:hypothetical protein
MSSSSYGPEDLDAVVWGQLHARPLRSAHDFTVYGDGDSPAVSASQLVEQVRDGVLRRDIHRRTVDNDVHVTPPLVKANRWGLTDWILAGVRPVTRSSVIVSAVSGVRRMPLR